MVEIVEHNVRPETLAPAPHKSTPSDYFVVSAIGRSELGKDPRFLSHAKRSDNYIAINNIVADWIRSRPVVEACASFAKRGVPHSLIYNAADILADPHYSARESIATLDHPVIGPIEMPNIFPRFSVSKPSTRRPAPTLGANTDDAFSTLLGMSAEQNARLRAAGTV